MIRGFSSPWAFAWSLLAIPILLAYMLKARRAPKVISSTFLWRQAEINVAASKPWQRLRASVLLILQLLALALLVLGLAGPYGESEGIQSDHLVLVIDASGSMLATDVAPDRIGAAKREALDLLASLPASSIASVISAGPQPRVAASSTDDRSVLRRAIGSVQATEGPSKMDEAMLLAESLETPGRPATIALISDGGMTQQEEALIPPGTVFRQIGSQASNLGITGLDVGEATGGFRAFVAVTNEGSRDRSAQLVLELDGAPVVSSRVRVNAATRTERAFDLGPRLGTLRARLDVDDDLRHDNQAFALLERTRPRRMLLVTPGNLFLEKLLQQLPGAEVDVTDATKVPQDGSGYDLVVYDRVEIPALVKAPALFVAPASLPKGVNLKGELPSPTIDFIAVDEPLMEQVDLSDVAIATARAVEIEGSKTLVASGEVPLVAIWAEGTLRRAWIGFDLHQSNLPVQVAFPILGDHLLGWLTGAAADPARHAGDSIDLPPVPGASTVKVTSPGGQSSSLGPGQSFTDTPSSGIYEIEFLDGGSLISERKVALSFPRSESRLLPREVAVESDPSRPGLVDGARRSIVLPFLALVLLLSTFEWWWAHGRPAPKLA